MKENLTIDEVKEIVNHLERLAEDAKQQAGMRKSRFDPAYWTGMKQGYERAINVIKRKAEI